MAEKIDAVIALGEFSCAHIGHKAVISAAAKLADELCALPVAFAFGEGLSEALGKPRVPAIFGEAEREELLLKAGAKKVVFAPTTKEFLSLGKNEFLEYLDTLFSVKGYVFGEDYAFGRKGEGNADFLCDYAARNGKIAIKVPLIKTEGEKVSSTEIRRLLSEGLVDKAAKLLGESYFIKGVVEKGRKEGRKIGFPTANLYINDLAVKEGVYYGRTKVFGKEYLSIINYGNCPTFSQNKKLVEVNIFDFSLDIYGETVTVFFDGYLRDIKKFASIKELTDRLEADAEITRLKADKTK